MRGHNLELDMYLRGIVMSRGELGATISEMRSDYYKLIGEPWPLVRYSTEQIIKYLMDIHGLMMEKFESGLCIWYIDDIGSNISREYDSNNNVVVIEDSVASVSNNQLASNNNSYALPACSSRRIITSSFVNDHGPQVSASSADTLHIELIDNVNRKRNLSEHSEHMPLHTENKRPKMLSPDKLALNEQNLNFHNRKNGANSMARQTTSTEIENSISIHSDLNGCIAASEYLVPINEPESKDLQRAFSKRCQINEKFNQTELESTISRADEIFPNTIGVLGDDFLRATISFELFGADFSDQNDKRFGYCISGLTIRDAYHLILDKQHQFTSKYRYLIVNVGAIDILLEHDLIDICAQFARLINAISTIGLKPIITTIPYVCTNVNNPNCKIIYQILLLFNRFVMSTYRDGYPVIDLYSHFSESTKKENYHNQPKIIVKDRRKLELWRWTEKGRKKILDAIDVFIQTCTEV